MIRAHRDRHRRIVWLMLLAVAALLAAALALRPEPPLLDAPIPGLEGFRD
jgi:hypothetical protein